MEFVPANNFRIEVGSSFAAYDINGVPGLEDRRQMNWQGVSLDLRYQFLDRRTAPFGLTFALETHGERIDEMTAEPASNFGTELTLAIDRELVPNRVVAAFNLFVPAGMDAFFQDRIGPTGIDGQADAVAVMAQIRPGFLIGGETRYLRKYDGIGLDEFAGQALFAGPTAYLQLSERSRLTLAWSAQVWGRPNRIYGIPGSRQFRAPSGPPDIRDQLLILVRRCAGGILRRILQELKLRPHHRRFYLWYTCDFKGYSA